MARPDRSQPMTVKHWTRAGVLLTDWCNARCASCYANCSPEGQTWMTLEQALGVWESLQTASPHGCRVHLTGGEPFGRFDYLLDLCRSARRAGLGPLESIETNAFWATDEAEIRRRLRALDEAGLGRLAISADPYHQEFVIIDHPRRLAAIAAEVLGPDRVRVRWQDWLETGLAEDLSPRDRRESYCEYMAEGRDRLIGRAAESLRGGQTLKPWRTFDDNPCGEKLLRGRHVHIAPTGEVWPATCVGIVLGNAFTQSVREIWQGLNEQWADDPLLGGLCQRGPAALAEPLAESSDAVGLFAGKCHLCYQMRRHLFDGGRFSSRLGPSFAYRPGERAEPFGGDPRKSP
jgi:MoaA/NifB/PqqE/SkfB family radical SAM enzyme